MRITQKLRLAAAVAFAIVFLAITAFIGRVYFLQPSALLWAFEQKVHQMTLSNGTVIRGTSEISVNADADHITIIDIEVTPVTAVPANGLPQVGLWNPVISAWSFQTGVLEAVDAIAGIFAAILFISLWRKRVARGFPIDVA